MAVKRRKDTKNRVLKDGEYQRANGTYEYRWQDTRGKRCYIYGKTLEELRSRIDDLKKDSYDGIRTPNKNLTVNDLYNLWLKVKRGLKDNTFQNYKYLYEMFIKSDLGEIKVSKLKRTDVRSFYNKLCDEKNIKVSTIDSIHTVLHQVLQLGVEDEYLRYNPSDNALKELKKAHNSDEAKKKALTVDEQQLFENFLKNSTTYNRWYPIFTVMSWTGLRVGELTGLRWSDVDLENDIINVNHTLVYYRQSPELGCRFAINTPKTSAGKRIIPMLPKVKEALLLEKQIQEETGVSCNVTIDGFTDFIFVNRFGDTQHQGTLNKALKRIIRDCNFEVLDKQTENSVILPNFSNHSLRHTFTTRMCEANVNIKAMQGILGHADAQITLNIYAEATKDFKLSEMANLNEYFNSENSHQLSVV